MVRTIVWIFIGGLVAFGAAFVFGLQKISLPSLLLRQHPLSKEFPRGSGRAKLPLALEKQEKTVTTSRGVVPRSPLEIPAIELPTVSPPAQGASGPPATTVEKKEGRKATTSPAHLVPLPALLPLDEALLLQAVVKIQCPTSDGLGKYVGSGFALKGGVIITAAHVVKDTGNTTCDVIFPHERRPVHYLHGVIRDLPEVRRRHDTDGIDVAVITLPSIESYPEARAIFSQYPYVPYPLCMAPSLLGDALLHFGYPSNYTGQDYLSELPGAAVTYADISGIKEQLSEDQTFTFKTPIFSFTDDQSGLHPYMISRVASFYGDSGGLAFDATRQCILGPHRGGTIGRDQGENYSVFPILGWEGARKALSP